MSTTEFLASAGMPSNIHLNSLELTETQISQIERLIEQRSASVTDYSYPVKEQVIARTGIADLKDSERWGSVFGLASYATFFALAGRRFNLLKGRTQRSFLQIGSLFVGAGVYHLFTQGAYRNYRGLSYKLNERTSAELNQMMDLKP